MTTCQQNGNSLVNIWYLNDAMTSFDFFYYRGLAYVVSKETCILYMSNVIVIIMFSCLEEC